MDHAPYEFTRQPDNAKAWHIDIRHVDVLHVLALALPRGSTICEIGSWKGASASAFIEAMAQREDLRLVIHDIEIQPELYKVLNFRGPLVAHRVTVDVKPAYESMDSPADLVFIDGDHKWPALADLAVCLAMRCKVIVLHDTNGYSPQARKVAHGSCLAARILKRSPGRKYWEDCKRRKGERTHRGLLVSWPREEEWVCSALSLE